MIDQIVIEAVTQIANHSIGKDHPQLAKHFNVSDVRYVCEAFYEFSKELLRRQECSKE